MSETKRIKDFFVLGSGVVLNMLFGILTTPVITRLVDPDDYGNVSLFVMYAEIVMVILGLGLDQTLVRYFYHDTGLKYRRKLLYSCWKLPVLCCLGVGAVVRLVFYLGQDVVKDGIAVEVFGNDIELSFFSNSVVLFLFIALVLCLLIQRYAVLVVRLQYKSFIYSLLNIAQKAFYVIIAILLIFSFGSSQGFIYLAIATIISYFLVCVLGIGIERKLWNPMHLKEVKLPYPVSELYRYGFPLIFSSSIARLLQACGSTMLKYYCDDTIVGIYASAINLVHFFSIIQTTFNAIWAPMMVEHYEKDKKDKEFYIKGNQIITFILFLFGATMLVCKDIFVIFLGEKYREAAFILPFLMFYPIMYTISETTNCGIVFMKKSSMNVWVSLASLVVNAFLCIVLIPSMGAIGAAIATAAGYTTFYVMRTLIARKYFPIDFRIGKLAVISILFAGFCLYGSYFNFGLIMLLMYLAFCVILCLIYKETVFEIIIYVKKIIRSKMNF